MEAEKELTQRLKLLLAQDPWPAVSRIAASLTVLASTAAITLNLELIADLIIYGYSAVFLVSLCCFAKHIL